MITIEYRSCGVVWCGVVKGVCGERGQKGRREGCLCDIFWKDTNKMRCNFGCQLTESKPIARGKASFQIEAWALGVVRSSPWWCEDDQVYGV